MLRRLSVNTMMVMCEDKCMHKNQLTITHKLSHISMYTPYTHQHKHTLNVTLLSIHVTKQVQRDVSTLRVIVSHNFMIFIVFYIVQIHIVRTFVHECSVMSTFSLTPQHEPLPYHNTHTCTCCTDINTLYKGAPQCTYTQTLY